MVAQDWTLPEPNVSLYTDEMMENAKAFSDTAMVVITRVGGEGADLPTDMASVVDGSWIRRVAQAYGSERGTAYYNGTYDDSLNEGNDWDKGDHFLQLSNREEDLLDLVTANFDNVILVYNGALEYGNRFLKNVFLDDPSVKLDLVFAPGVIRSKNTRSPIRFERAGELEKYDVIVLFNLNRSQTSPEMERVLREYVEKGGGIIFITGNPMIAAEFSNSPLEKLLPVRFSERYNAQKRYDVRTAGIVRLIASGRRRPTDFDRALQRNSEMRYKEHPLHDFVLTRIGRESPIFKRTLPDGSFRLITPRFEDYAPVSGIKPEFRDAEGKAHVLLAYQNFGQGRCMVLATDPLWRWKLKTSSKDPSFEVFWKNLFSWLALGRDNDSRWKIPNLVMTSGSASEMDFFPGSGLSPATPISFTLENGKKEKQNLSAVREGGRYHFSIPFPAPGEYRVAAKSDGRELASAAFSVSESSLRSGEDAALEPDLERLEEFSRLPNVSLLSAKESPDFSVYFPAERLELAEESIFPLWNRAWTYLLIVGLIYLVEVLSVIIQVTYFKKTGGKRIFRMAPIHHHFELGGWSETRVVAVFSIVTAILCLVALIGL